MRTNLLLLLLASTLSAASLPVIPDDLAHITDAYLPDEKLPDFILVQDVHQHAEVQAKIARLILHAYTQWGVHRIFMEGAFHRVDVSVFHRLPASTREDLLTYLLQQGKLSGPEMAAVVVMEKEWRNPEQSTLQLLGMENARLYAQNLRVFEKVMKLRPEALKEIASLQRLQDSLQLPEPNILRAQLERAESLVRLQLTPDEYALYLSARDVLPHSPRLTPAVEKAEQFYVLVNHRSAEFLRQADRQLPAGQGPRLLVVGGFHTDFMAKNLRDQHVPYIVLSPTITSGADRSTYEKELLTSVGTITR